MTATAGTLPIRTYRPHGARRQVSVEPEKVATDNSSWQRLREGHVNGGQMGANTTNATVNYDKPASENGAVVPLEESLPQSSTVATPQAMPAQALDDITRAREARARAAIQAAVADLFATAQYEAIEDGAISEFERALISLVEKHGVPLLEFMEEQIRGNKVAPQIIYEALQVLGAMRHPPTHNYRFWLLMEGLKSSSVWLRDGAALGFSSLNNARALPFLKKALAGEQIPGLRRYIERVISRLEKLA